MITTKEKPQIVDEVLEELYQHKRDIAKEHNYDVSSLIKDLQERQSQFSQLVYPESQQSSTESQNS
jgi:hypothetical protein